jgi:hypothetical protein
MTCELLASIPYSSSVQVRTRMIPNNKTNSLRNILMNKIILSAVIATMLSTPLAWAGNHHYEKAQPAKIIITQPVQHVIKNHETKNHVTKNHATKNHATKNHATKNHVTKNHVVKNQVVKNHVAKKYVAHRTIINEPVNYQHQSQNKSHTGKFISNIAGLVLIIK